MARRKKNKKGKKVARVLLILLCIVLTLVLLVLSFAAYYADHLLDLVERYDEQEETIYTPEEVAATTQPTESIPEDFTGQIYEEEVTVPVPETIPPEVEEVQANVVNILLVGQDRREGQGRQRSDSMILCTFNKDNNTITMTSFMRDLYVQIPGYQTTKMNAAYAWGGMPLLMETMYVNFGIRVDACVEVDFGGFEDVIDLLGGVDIYLSEREAAYFRDTFGYDAQKGTNHMDGAFALNYARLRSIDSDFNRTQRQRNVLTAIFNKYKSLSLTEMTNLLNKILPLVKTNMSNSEMINYLVELFPVVAAGNMSTMRIPADGMYESAYVNKQYVLLADMEANRQLLYDMLLGN